MDERLKELRKVLGLTKTAFGEELGVSDTAIYSIEKGKSKGSAPLFRLICAKFCVNENWLLKGEGEMFCKDLPPHTIFEGLSMPDRQIIMNYASLSQKQRDVFKSILASILKSEETPPE